MHAGFSDQTIDQATDQAIDQTIDQAAEQAILDEDLGVASLQTDLFRLNYYKSGYIHNEYSGSPAPRINLMCRSRQGRLVDYW